MKRLLALALLLPAPTMAQSPSPAQVGITTAVPNVVQVYDSSHNWATIGNVDPTTHLFTPTLPIASTTTLGAVKVDGTTITATGAGVISGTPAGITANSTATSGFAAGQFLRSDGTKVQAANLFGAPPLVSQYNGTTAQGFRVYNSYTDASNGEWGAFDWTTTPGVLTIGAQANGTGAARGIKIIGADGHLDYGVTAGGLWTIYGYYGLAPPNSGGTFLGFPGKHFYTLYTDGINIGPSELPGVTCAAGSTVTSTLGIVTACGSSGGGGTITAGTTPTSGFAAGAVLYSDGSVVKPAQEVLTQWGGNPSFPIYLSGSSSYPGGLTVSGQAGVGVNGIGLDVYPDGRSFIVQTNNYNQAGYELANLTAATIGGHGDIGFGSSGASIANVHDPNSPTTATAFRVYNTLTDPSNGEWGAFDWQTTPNVLTIGTVANGTGSARGIKMVAGAQGIWDYGSFSNFMMIDAGGLLPTVAGTYLGGGGHEWVIYGSVIDALTRYTINGVSGVSCTAGQVSVSTFGLVTGCSATKTTNAVISNGTQPTITGAGGTCATTTKVGGATAGTVVLSAVCASTNTIAFTGMPASTNGYACDATDRTTRTAGPFQESASTTTSFTLTVGATSSVAADVLQWKCIGY